MHLTGVQLINPLLDHPSLQSENVRLSHLTVSHRGAVKAPSSDAVDIDVCPCITNCNISVNDDAIALKGARDPMQTSWKRTVPTTTSSRIVPSASSRRSPAAVNRYTIGMYTPFTCGPGGKAPLVENASRHPAELRIYSCGRYHCQRFPIHQALDILRSTG